MKRTLKMGGSLRCKRVFFMEQSLFCLCMILLFPKRKIHLFFVVSLFFNILALNSLLMKLNS